MAASPHDPAAAIAEERAVRIAMACSAIGAVSKFAAGAVTGSMALISSAVDSMGDLLISTANLFVVRYGHQPPDEDHNYGHDKIEGLGAMFEGGFIGAAGLFIGYEAVHKAIVGETSHDSTVGIAVMVPVLGMTIGTVLHLRKIARQTGSLVLRSDALHYLTDVWVNVGVLFSLLLVKLTGQPLIDTVVAMGIAVFMLHSSVQVVRDGFDVLMDRSLDGETVRKIGEILGRSPEIQSFHELRTRGGKAAHVDVHIVVRADMSAREIHDLFTELERGIQELVGPATIVHVHADPAPEPAAV